MNIGQIVWPKDRKEAVALYLNFVIAMVDKFNLNESGALTDPIRLAKSYSLGQLSDEKYKSSATEWWSFVDENGLRNLETKEVLIARVAICLLSATTDEVKNLGEHLSWFMQLLHKLNIEMALVVNDMNRHFADK